MPTDHPPRRHHLSSWMGVLLATLWLLLGAGAAGAQPLADPRVDWFTADSAHFRVHYRTGQRAQAEAVARAAERAYPVVTQALEWKPRTRTEIVVYTEFDLANGFTTPLPYSFMGVFLAPPDDGELLDNSAWLDLLLVHEFTHAVHLDKVRGAPRVLQSIFGNVTWFIPNVFMPGWGIEGPAVVAESDPAAGRGRLRGPLFEAWLRAERARGFISLREINADGRRTPLNKQYLYGAYFVEFINRRYGPKAMTGFITQYSGNVVVPRLHSGPWGATGKMMDELWEEFIADLTRQVDERSAAVKAQAEVVGAPLAGPLFDIEQVVAQPAQAGGGWLAVMSDGLMGTHLWRLGADGSRERLVRLNRGARLDVAADGGVLVTQPDVCNTLYYAYDVYRLSGRSLQPLSHCAHLRRAVQAGGAVLALELDAGATRLVRLGAPGQPPQVLLQPEAGHELLDLAASPDGRRVAVVSRRGGDWRVLELDLTQPQAAAQMRVRRNSPLHGLRWGAQGLELIVAEAGAQAGSAAVPNVWRLQGDQLVRLTHSHTAVLAQAGSAADGSLVTAVIAPEGVALHRLAQPAALQTATAVQPVPEPAAAAEPPAGSGLQAERSYSALRSVYPRSWLPAITADRGLTAYGASTSGGDALGWHRYALLAQVETSQRELIGTFEYQFAGSHGVSLTRELVARAWTTANDKDTTTVYDRSTRAQWLSLFPFTRVQRRVVAGVGAAADFTDRVTVASDSAQRRRDERVLAALLDVDFTGSDWYAEGSNRGVQGSLLVESYRPFSGGTRYSGTVVRADLRGYLPLPLKSVLALRFTEARASGSTEPFALGDATDEVLQFGPVLNDRTLSLRGYRNGDPGLVGRNARVATLEWRVPLADIDRHFMVPALGINRLSGAVFADVGGAWDGSSGPDRWRRGVGVELLAEARLLYALGLNLRVGVARGLDEPRDTRGYLSFGRAF